MLFKLTLLYVLCFTVGQDYEEYQPQPRSAPARLHPGNGPVEPLPTPVPILKQINRHNEDGSYTYGYEGADGAFKIETKSATGEVKGKYGYVDDTGKVRVVEYGANKYGFQPFGEGITVAPPTLVDETTNNEGLQIVDYEDEQQPTPSVPAQKSFNARIPRPQQQQRSKPRFQPQSQQQYTDQISSPHAQQFLNREPMDVYSAKQRPSDSEYTQTQTFFPNPHHKVSEQQEYEKSDIGRSYSSPSGLAQGIKYSVPGAQPMRVHDQQQHAQQQFQPQKGRSTSILDQLAKDYGLPPGGSPALHDISYSYY